MTCRFMLLPALLIALLPACTTPCEGESAPFGGNAAAGSMARLLAEQAAEDGLYGPTPEGCTSIMVGRLVSEDGSVMTSHTCDGRYRTWIDVVPARKHAKGSKAKIYKGRMKTEFPSDERGVTVMGEIDQVAATFAILDTAYPCMNEHQLAMGESTFGGRRELVSKKGIFYVEELQRIALERARTAREAILLMGELASEHGYIDSGEALTIADPKEVWHFEILGPGKEKKGAVWAAVRIPDDHVGVAANISRISTLDLDDPDHYLASENVVSLAEEMGWFDRAKGEPFRFWKAYSGKKPFRIREFWVLNDLAPSLHLDFFRAKELPLSVKPDRDVSVKDLFRLFRAAYEGTRYALNANLLVPKPVKRAPPKKSVAKAAAKAVKKEAGVDKKPVKSKELLTLEKATRAALAGEEYGADGQVREMEVCASAHPWLPRDMWTMINGLVPGTITFHRPVAVMFNAYHTVIQCRDWLPDPIGGICWLGFDNPAQTPRVPIFCGVTDLPADFKIDNHKKYRTDSASWAFRRASRLACIRWGKNREKLLKEIVSFEEQALAELPAVEKRAGELFVEDPKKACEILTRYCASFCNAVTHRFWQLGDEFWMEYMYYL
jgi:dipeptidase